MRYNGIKRLVLASAVISGFALFPAASYSLAETGYATGPDSSGAIRIEASSRHYSLVADRAILSDVLRELGKTAGFEVKIFESADTTRQDWHFDSMPLANLLYNLLRGYSTVMLYEQSDNNSKGNDQQVLKELWLIGQSEPSEPVHNSQINIAIQLEQTDTPNTNTAGLTPEQQYEISYIDNLEGMTGDDVIGILRNTLMTEEDPLVRKRAITALSDIGGTRVLDALETGMSDGSAVVRTELAKSLSGIQDQRSMLLLGQLLMGDRNPGVRRQAVFSLQQQNTEAAHTFVQAALKDKDRNVQKAAEVILRQWPLPAEN